jgi:tetratricopeptide (TPR) repeat protein
MHKLFLVFFLFAAVNVKAQIPDIFVSRPIEGGPITITYFTPEDFTGDDYLFEAEQNERKGNLNRAVTLYGKAAFEFNSSKKNMQYGLALLKLSNVHMLLNNYTEAEQVVLNVALKNYSKTGNVIGEMNSYQQLAKIYLAANKLTQALWFSTQQGILAQRLSNNNSYIQSILGLALVKIKKQEFNLANRDLNRAELLAKNGKLSAFNGQIRDARKAIAIGQNGKKHP